MLGMMVSPKYVRFRQDRLEGKTLDLESENRPFYFDEKTILCNVQSVIGVTGGKYILI